MKKTIRIFSIWSIVIGVIILLIAAVPRSVEFFSHNFVFGFDQGKHWLAAKAIIVDHKFPLIGDEVGGARGFFQGPGWFYLLAVPFFLFNGNPYGAVVLTFLLGMSAVFLSYILFTPLLGFAASGLIGFFLAISPTLISSSRFAWPPYAIPPLMVIYLYFIYRVLEKKRQYIPWIFLTIGIMAHFEIATAGTVLLTTLFLAMVYAISNRISFKNIIFSCIAFIIPLFPLIVFDLRHDFLNTKGIFETFFASSRTPSFVPTIQQLFSNHKMIFEAEFFGSFQLGYMNKLSILFVLSLGILMFFDKSVPKHRKLFLSFLYLFPLVLFAICMGYRNDLWGWWLLELQVIGCFLFGSIMTHMVTKKHVIWKIFAIVVIGFMFINYLQSSVRFWKNDYPDYGGTAKIRGKIDALDFIFQDAQTKDFGLFFFTPPVYTYAYDFVNWWHGTRAYDYVPPQEKKKIFYLLAEPDSEKPWTYKGWMETAIIGGEIVNTWTLPSGFIVQKRMMTE